MRSMTVCHRCLVLAVISQLSFELGGMASGIRKKRVLHGFPTEAGDRDEYYPHFRYFVYLAKPAWPGQIDEDPGWFKKWFKIGLTPPPYTLHCAGSLLTPSIVQTACHCLGKFTKRKGNFTIGSALDVWEDRIYSYVGSNIVSELCYLLVPHSYILHAACRKVVDSGPVVYDFAVIVNKESVFERAEGAEISYVPVYRAVDIKDFYYTAIKKEYTCLFIGFGKWTYTTSADGQVKVENLLSDVLRWGWRSLRSYKDCMALSYPLAEQKLGVYDYRERSTSVCLSSTTKKGYHHAALHGDSGGPVSCNNVYFAIQSGGRHYDNNRICDTLADPIAYTPFENAAESRADFIKYCNEFVVKAPESRPTRPPNRYKPTPPPRRSQCPSNIIPHRFMILSFTLFTRFSYHF